MVIAMFNLLKKVFSDKPVATKQIAPITTNYDVKEGSIVDMFKAAIKQNGDDFLVLSLNRVNFSDLDKQRVYEIGNLLVSAYTSLTTKSLDDVLNRSGLTMADGNFVDSKGNTAPIQSVVNQVFTPDNLCEMGVDFFRHDYRFGTMYAKFFETNFKAEMVAGEALLLNYFSVKGIEPSHAALKGQNTWSLFKAIEPRINHLISVDVKDKHQYKDDEVFSPNEFILSVFYENEFKSLSSVNAYINSNSFNSRHILNDKEAMTRINAQLKEGYTPDDLVIETVSKIPKSRMSYR